MFTTNADVSVMGSGLLGLSTALELLRRDLTVTVVGPRTGPHTGQASRAAGAMLTVFSEVEAAQSPGRVATEVGQRVLARHLYDTWLADLSQGSGQPVELTPGVWVIANGIGEDDAAELAAISDAAHRHDACADYASPAEVPGLRPQVRPFQALWLPWEASVDPVQLMQSLSTLLAAHPRCTWIDADAVEINELGEHLAVTASNGDTILAAHLVLAAGAASGRLLHGCLAESAHVPPVLSGRGVSLTLSAGFDLPSAVRTVNRGFACGSHLVPRGDGSVYLGGTNRLSTAPDYAQAPSLDEIATLAHDGAAELHTGLRDATLIAARVGHRPVTIDHLPLFGTTAHPMIHMATATYRCGVLLAPLAANIVADGITAPGSQAEHPYRPTRDMEIPPLEQLLRTSARGLVAMLCQPGGSLPAGTDETLGQILRTLLTEISSGTGTRAAVMQRIWQRAPMVESVPLLLDAVGRLA